MKLKSAVFYQSVQIWDGSQTQTVKAGNGVTIDLEEHLVKLCKEGSKDVIIVPTANLRHSLTDYQDAFALTPQGIESEMAIKTKENKKFSEDMLKAANGETVSDEVNEEPMITPKKKANAK